MSRLVALLPGSVVFLLLSASQIPWPLPPGFVRNPDASVRLERIRQWLDGGEWYARALERVGDAPVMLHWTRPLDMLTALFAWPFEALGPQTALVAGAALLAVCTGLAVLVVLSRLLPPFARPTAPIVAFTVLFAALLPEIRFVFMVQGWPDHHGLLYLLFLLALLFARQTLEGRAHAPWLLGLSQALALWISPEALIGIAAVHAGLGLVWLFRGGVLLPRWCLYSAVAFAVGLVGALTAEFGTPAPDTALDRLSLVSLYIAAALVLTWGGLAATAGWRMPRAVLAGVWGFVGAAVLLTLAPDLASGPMAHTDPWFLDTWDGLFGDGFSLPLALSLSLIALGGASAVFMAWRFADVRPAVYLLVPSLAVFAILGVLDSPRWAIYGELAALAPSLAVAARLHARIPWTAGRAVAVVAVLFAPTLGLIAHLQRSAEPRCEIAPLIETLESLPTGRILAHANLTPSLLFHTRHSVTAVPIHPNARAVHDSFTVLSQPPGQVDADWLVVCPHGFPARVYGRDPSSLHSVLAGGENVAGLSFVTEAGGYRLYRVAP